MFMDIYEHARSVLKMHGTMLGNAGNVGKGGRNIGKCWKMLETCPCICVNVFTHSLLYQAPTFENQFCKFAENEQFVPGVQRNKACQFQARLKLTRTVLAYSSSRMHGFGDFAKLVSHVCYKNGGLQTY